MILVIQKSMVIICILFIPISDPESDDVEDAAETNSDDMTAEAQMETDTGDPGCNDGSTGTHQGNVYCTHLRLHFGKHTFKHK